VGAGLGSALCGSGVVVDGGARSAQRIVDKVRYPPYKVVNPVVLGLLFYVTVTPIALLTSFNVRGEPIVRTPEDAFRCFMGTKLDVLAVGNLYLQKRDQNVALKADYRNAFELD
jgi:predicted NodU family carbamoyl transferase